MKSVKPLSVARSVRTLLVWSLAICGIVAGLAVVFVSFGGVASVYVGAGAVLAVVIMGAWKQSSASDAKDLQLTPEAEVAYKELVNARWARRETIERLAERRKAI